MKNTNWKVPVIIGVGVLAVILMIVFGVQSSQNKAIALEEQVNTASSDIKVQEKRRVDLVYNLADCVKQYDKHEADTLTAVADGRGSTGDIENVTTAITAVAEAYPELKSNENYKTLMNELSMTENMIAEYRSNYNKQIKEYKRKKFDDGYKTIADTIEINQIDKVFDNTTHKTANEMIDKKETAEFYNTWLKANKGIIKDKTKGKLPEVTETSDSSSSAPSTPAVDPFA